MFSFRKPSLYEPLPGSGTRRVRPSATWGLIALAMMSVIAVWTIDLRGPLMSRLGVSSFRFAATSQHTEPVSVVLMAGQSENSIGEVVEALLAHTVGPYEIIGVYSSHDDSERIATRAIEGYLQASRSSSQGLRRYRSVTPSPDISPAEARIIAVKTARHRHVAIVNADDLLTTYGWDRVLLTGIKSSEQLLGVSGRAAANIEHYEQAAHLIDPVGEPLPESHAAAVSGPDIVLRHVALRSPMMYDGRKMARLGWTGIAQEDKGLGDMDMCLRGRRDHGWVCGYYPVAVETKDAWRTVPGTPSFGLEFELSTEDVEGLRLRDHQLGEDEYRTVPAIPRRAPDVPRTIVTAVTGRDIPAFLQLHGTLDWSTFTRVIVYLLPHDDPSCLEALRRLPDLDLRYAPGRISSESSASMPLLASVAAEVGGLVLWVDPDRLLNSETQRIWSDIARSGVWMGRRRDQVDDAGLPSSETLNAPTECDAAVLGVNAQHPAYLMIAERLAETGSAEIGDVGFTCTRSTLEKSRSMAERSLQCAERAV